MSFYILLLGGREYGAQRPDMPSSFYGMHLISPLMCEIQYLDYNYY